MSLGWRTVPRKLLPSALLRYAALQEVLAATEHDKKNTGTAHVMVFPRRIGECVVVSDVSEDEIGFGIDAMLRRFTSPTD